MSLRSRLKDVLVKHGIKQVQVARETGIHNTTLSLWLSGKVKGNTTRLENNIEAWLAYVESTGRATDNERYQRISESPEPPKEILEELVPVSVDMPWGKEVFTWNKSEHNITPTAFANILCEDTQTSQSTEMLIAQRIEQRLDHHEKYVDPRECIKVIQIRASVGEVVVTDKILWDIGNQTNSPEEFAYELCSDLGLNGEFACKIAHQIREQVLYHQGLETRKGYIPSESYRQLARGDDIAQWGPDVHYAM